VLPRARQVGELQVDHRRVVGLGEVEYDAGVDGPVARKGVGGQRLVAAVEERQGGHGSSHL
jgi:hypothetical protein